MDLNTFLDVQYQHKQLLSGAYVHLFYKKNSPITIRAIARAGSRYDVKEGTAHFMEHMLVAGTKDFSSKDKLSNYIEKTGGNFSASTGLDYLRFTVEIAQKEDLSTAFTILQQVFVETLFDPNTFEKERGSIIAELHKKKSSPAEFIWEVYRKLFFQGTELARSTLGTIESIQSIMLEDIKQFKEQYLNASNIDFIVSGDVEMHELTDFIENAFTVNPGQRITIDKPIPVITDKKIEFQHYSIDQIHFIAGFRVPLHSYKEHVALNILMNYLVVGRSSYLITELRYKRGLIYSISGINSHLLDWATFTFQSSCSKDHLQEVISVIKHVVVDLSDTTFTENMLKDRKSKIIKSLIINLQTSHAWVQFNESGLLDKQPTIIADYVKRVEEITIEDIITAAKKYLVENVFYVALCGPNMSEELIVEK